MKKITIVLLSVVAIAVMSAKTLDFTPKKSHAEVNQIQGLYVFTDSKPLAEYEYLGTVKVTLTLIHEQYQPLRDIIIKKAKKQYPNADGIIINFVNGGTDTADAIKFK